MSRKSVPSLTHLHYLVLSVLRSGEQPGRVLRKVFATYGVKRTAPAFYQLMARLETSRLVEGWYEQVVVHDQAVTERRYRITTDGTKAWNQARAFYADIEERATEVRWSDA